MSENKQEKIEEYSKKERVVNCWLSLQDVEITQIANIANCSYEYARRIIREIESGDIDPSEYRDTNLQKLLDTKYDTMSRDNQVQLFESERSKESESVKDWLTERDDSKKEIDVEVEDPDNISHEQQESSGKPATIKANSLQACLQSVTELKSQAEYYVEQGDKSALWQYYVAARAEAYINDLLSQGDEIQRSKVKHTERVFLELYNEANFESEHGRNGAEKKKYAAMRVSELLRGVLEDTD
jgi:hypothetical protein